MYTLRVVLFSSRLNYIFLISICPKRTDANAFSDSESSNFSQVQGGQRIARGTQEILQTNAEIADKGNFRTETN